MVRDSLKLGQLGKQMLKHPVRLCAFTDATVILCRVETRFFHSRFKIAKKDYLVDSPLSAFSRSHAQAGRGRAPITLVRGLRPLT